MGRRVRAEEVLPEPPGEVVTDLLLRLSLAAGTTVRPQLETEGTRLTLPGGWLTGRGDLLVSAEGEGTRVVLAGTPPPWPLSCGWARRRLRRLLG